MNGQVLVDGVPLQNLSLQPAVLGRVELALVGVTEPKLPGRASGVRSVHGAGSERRGSGSWSRRSRVSGLQLGRRSAGPAGSARAAFQSGKREKCATWSGSARRGDTAPCARQKPVIHGRDDARQDPRRDSE